MRVNGTFDKSENVITRDRIKDARIVGPEYEFSADEADYYDKGKRGELSFIQGKKH